MAKPLKEPRKLPKQGRSVDLVNAIYAASVRIFAAGKKARFSTRTVAEMAGVSIGSLYQYFPNKDALIGVLIERQIQLHFEILRNELAAEGDLEFGAVIERVTRKLLQRVYEDRDFLRGLLPNVFAVGRLGTLVDVRAQAVDHVGEILMQKGLCKDKASAHGKAFILVAAFGGLVEHIVFYPKDDLDLERFSDDTAELVRKFCGV